jgi:hypothetical protein
MGARGNWRWTGPLVAAWGWAVVWSLLLASGVQYEVRVLYAGWQMVPWDELAADPLGSVWNLHRQSPLWNGVLGVFGARSPFGETASLALVSLTAGCVLAAAVCSTLLHLGASLRVAWALTAMATLNTQVLVHAFQPTYDMWTAAMVASLVWSVARVGDNDTLGWRALWWPVFLGAWAADSLWVHSTRWSLSLVVATIGLFTVTLSALRRRHRDGTDQRRTTTLIVASTTVIWTMTAGIVGELAEQQRFRSATDPIVLAIGGLLVTRAATRIHRRFSYRRRHRQFGA